MTAILPRLVAAFVVLAGVAWAATPPKPDAKVKPNSVAPKSTDKRVEPIGKVDGVTIERPNGTFLGLQVVNNNFVLSFYNEKRRKMAPDVTRATVRWPVKYQPTDDRAVLNPGADGTSLTSAKTIRPPHLFRVALNLFVEGSESAVETYAVDYTAAADAPQ